MSDADSLTGGMCPCEGVVQWLLGMPQLELALLRNVLREPQLQKKVGHVQQTLECLESLLWRE